MVKQRDYYNELICLFNDYQNHYPFAYFELARTRRTDWMVWVKETPNGQLIISTQELTAKEACKKAVNQLQKYLKKLEKGKSNGN